MSYVIVHHTTVVPIETTFSETSGRSESRYPENPDELERRITNTVVCTSADAAQDYVERQISENGCGPVVASDDEFEYHAQGFILVEGAEPIWTLEVER